MNLKHTDVDFCPSYFSQLGMSLVNLEIYCNEKRITVHLNINACFLQYIYLLFFYCFMLLILISCDYVSMYPSHSQRGKIFSLQLGNRLS